MSSSFSGPEMNASSLLNIYQCPFVGSESEWNPKKYIVFNILASDFSNELSIMKFSELKSGATRTILYILASIIKRTDLGTSFVNNSNYKDGYYCEQGISKTTQIFEELRGGEKEEKFLGFRLWIFINDSTYDLSKGFLDLIESNKKKSDQKENMKNPGEKKIYETVDSPDKLAEIWCEYLRDFHYFGNIDSIHGENNSIIDPESKINPFQILNISNAIKLQPKDVCEIQSNESTYFDTDEGIDAEHFLKKFPKPHYTYKYKIIYFNPQTLDIAPVPNYMRNCILKHQNITEECKKQQQQIQQRLDYEDDENERENLIDEMHRVDYDIERSTDQIDSIVRDLNPDSEDMNNISSLFQREQEKFKKRNEFMVLSEKNEKKLSKLKEEFQPCTVEYENVMDNFYTEALEEFWKTFKTSNNVTGAVKSIRSWVNGFSPEDWWHENNQFISNLSPYGNMIVRMVTEMDKLFRIETNFQLALIGLGVNLSAHRFSWKLRPNLLLTGEGGIGKSFLMEWLEELSAPGTVINVTHITQQAFNTDQDISDLSFHLNEIPESMLGIDKYGNNI